jgi:hypothetical protein
MAMITLISRRARARPRRQRSPVMRPRMARRRALCEMYLSRSARHCACKQKLFIYKQSCLLIAFNTKTHTSFSLMGTNLSNSDGSRRSMRQVPRAAGKSGYTAEVKFTTASGKQDLKLANERYDPQLQGVGC